MTKTDLFNKVQRDYFNGASYFTMMKKYGLTKWQLTRIIDKVIEKFPPDETAERVERARIMERNVFRMIERNEECDSEIMELCKFCA